MDTEKQSASVYPGKSKHHQNLKDLQTQVTRKSASNS